MIRLVAESKSTGGTPLRPGRPPRPAPPPRPARAPRAPPQPMSPHFARSETFEASRRFSMSRRLFGAPHPSGSPGNDRPALVAGHRVRLSILSWAQAGLLAALVAALVVLTCEPTPHKDMSPA